MSFTLNITSCTGKIDLLQLLCNEMVCFIGKYKYIANVISKMYTSYNHSQCSFKYCFRVDRKEAIKFF